VPSLSLRINLDPDGRIGPGKVQLLETIAELGSISAAARRMNMSYKHAWDLIEETNRIFGTPVLETQKGGRTGGGARLSETGRAVIEHYRAVEKAALDAAGDHMAALQGRVRQE
jgi:molybdate transport system regulatory protein